MMLTAQQILEITASCSDPFLGQQVWQTVQSAKSSRPDAASWDDARRYLRDLYPAHLSAVATWAKHRFLLDRWPTLCDSPGQVDASTMAALVSLLADGRRTATVNSYLLVARRQLSLFDGRGWLRSNPWSVRRWFLRSGSGETASKHVPFEAVGKILALADAEASQAVTYSDRFRALRRRALLYLIAYTGIRKLEALYLRRSDLRDGIVWISEADHSVKTPDSAAPVAVPPEALGVLEDWSRRLAGEFLFPGQRVDRPWIYGRSGFRALEEIQALARRAGVAGVTLHGLRHSWATHAEQVWGKSQLQIKRQLRHSNERTQQLYRHPDLVNLRAMVADVSYALRTN